MAKKKTREDIEKVLAKIEIPNREFHLLTKGDGYLLQMWYSETDVMTGKPATQKTRKHYISPYSTETEIVDTAFYCALRSAEHQLREHFLYKGERVQSPHFDVRARLTMCGGMMFDKRED